MKKSIFCALLCTTIVFSLGACKNSSKDNITETTTEEIVFLEPLLIEEDIIYSVPIVQVSHEQPAPADNAAKHQKKSTTKSTETTATTSASTPVKVTAIDFTQNLAKVNIVPAKKVDTTFFCFTSQELNTIKTITSYSKNETEVMKVVSDPTNPNDIDYIVFTDQKKNKGITDVYGISAGMTAKEARHLRKDLNHFVKKGKVFLYSEDSNILYEMDGITTDGQEVTQEHVDNMNISAIIWKDKKDNAHVALTDVTESILK